MTKNPIVEVCIDSVESARIAQDAGAYRVELCANLSEGGTTPSIALIELVRELLSSVKLYVLIRPRGGDFYYNDAEFEMMKREVHACGKAGCDGVVIGLLNIDGTIDMVRNRELVDIAKKYAMGVTFHRAFDRCSDLFQGLEEVISLGCERILTSGGKLTAIEGAEVLKQLIQQAKNRITIMPGAGVTPENAAGLLEKTGASEIHGTFRSRVQSSMTYKSLAFANDPQEYSYWLADKGKIEAVVKGAR